MSVGNIGSGTNPSGFPDDKGNSQESSSSSKKTASFWSKIKGSSRNVSNKEATSPTTQRKITSKSPRSQKSGSRERKLGNLEEKTKGLSSSAAGFSETAGKLEEKYKKRAESKISKRICDSQKREQGFLSFVKGKLQVSKKEEDDSLSSKSSEEVSNTLEYLEQFEDDVREEAEIVEAANSCLDDCCGCLKKLKSLFKRKTHNREGSKSPCCDKFKKSLLNIKEKITGTTESIKQSIKKRMHLVSVSFGQQVHKRAIRKLLQTSNLENRTGTVLLGIKSLAAITGFDCKFSKNGLSFIPKSLEEEIFFSKVRTFSKLVDEFLVEIDEIDNQKVDSEEIQKQLEEVVMELSSYSNYFLYLLGLF